MGGGPAERRPCLHTSPPQEGEGWASSEMNTVLIYDNQWYFPLRDWGYDTRCVLNMDWCSPRMTAMQVRRDATPSFHMYAPAPARAPPHHHPPGCAAGPPPRPPAPEPLTPAAHRPRPAAPRDLHQL